MLHNFSPKSLDIIEVVTTLQHGNKMIKDHIGPIWWETPEVGNLVINVDAALDDQMKTNSSKGVIRDHLGSVIHSFYTFLSHTVNPLLAELRAIEEGLLWVNKLHLYKFSISDCLNAINRVNMSLMNRGDLEFFILKIRNELLNPNCKGLYFIP
uniref:RNase H type-1 domain-containing protein n=1 Tax=Cannabis sativa TaxID=3483 RepID=A0A803P2Q7_CANSA